MRLFAGYLLLKHGRLAHVKHQVGCLVAHLPVAKVIYVLQGLCRQEAESQLPAHELLLSVQRSGLLLLTNNRELLRAVYHARCDTQRPPQRATPLPEKVFCSSTTSTSETRITRTSPHQYPNTKQKQTCTD